MGIIIGIGFGFMAWFLVKNLVAGIYTVNQNEGEAEITLVPSGGAMWPALLAAQEIRARSAGAVSPTLKPGAATS